MQSIFEIFLPWGMSSDTDAALMDVGFSPPDWTAATLGGLQQNTHIVLEGSSFAYAYPLQHPQHIWKDFR